jgi:predicted ABC-type ATPase
MPPRRTHFRDVVIEVVRSHSATGKPLAVVVAGHNGSGKSTMWRDKLAPRLQVPLVNADRMMMSILPEPKQKRGSGVALLPDWARTLRDREPAWMQVAQKGVEAFVAQAMAHGVPFAMETVFSYLRTNEHGEIVESKVDLIRQMQKNGYYVVLFFVGLASVDLSILRVSTRVASGGHDVALERLEQRFPRTQQAIGLAATVADMAILVDNSIGMRNAFSVARVQRGASIRFDCRRDGRASPAVKAWLDKVAPSFAT